jgi:hypothetical protein
MCSLEPLPAMRQTSSRLSAVSWAGIIRRPAGRPSAVAGQASQVQQGLSAVSWAGIRLPAGRPSAVAGQASQVQQA